MIEVHIRCSLRGHCSEELESEVKALAVIYGPDTSTPSISETLLVKWVSS